jgi:hypothetical protein
MQNRRYGAIMETLTLQRLDLTRKQTPKHGRIQIEAAVDCDGSICHQPIFREDGTLNYVAPHSHLLEHSAEGTRYYAVFCDFPLDHDLFATFA